MTFGKKLETCNFEFELPEHNYNNRLEITRETVIRKSMPGQHYADGLNPQTRGNERMIEEITIKFSPGTNIGWVNVRQLPHKITFLYPNRSARTYLLRALPTNSIQR